MHTAPRMMAHGGVPAGQMTPPALFISFAFLTMSKNSSQTKILLLGSGVCPGGVMPKHPDSHMSKSKREEEEGSSQLPAFLANLLGETLVQ